ncbi:MAG: TIR domain-containing protein [Desulfobacterales bacterium]
MPTTDDILKEPQIADFLCHYHGAKAAVEKAAEMLQEKPDAVRAVKKLQRAHAEKEISVFFSYKKKDECAAKAVVKLLRENSAEKLRIAYQADITKNIVGQEWRTWIHTNVRQSNWFVLLLPDPSEDWDWCLFETGLFEAQRTSADRLICLHHPETSIPDPIKDYHAVKADSGEVEEFLRMIFVEENPIPGMKPLNKSIEKEIPRLAQEIVDAIIPPCKIFRQTYEPWIELKCVNAADLKDQDDLDKALISKSNDKALDLFDFELKPDTLGDLRSGLPKARVDGRWCKELLHVIRRLAGGRKFYPIQAVFQTNEGKIYRPVLCAVDRLGGENGPIATYHVTFTEEVSAIDGTAMPERVAGLASLLRFVFRFRWEVLEKFGTGPITEEDVTRLENALRRIAKDWESRGMGGQECIIGLFPPEHTVRLTNMFASWRELRNPEGTGKLDSAIENKDLEEIHSLLSAVLPINQEFLELAADNFAELLSEKKPA